MATAKGVVKSKVLFDYTKPELHGYLYKQGALHKAFKKRYFVLYPGYLVYYTDEAKYRGDVAKGSLQVKACLNVKRMIWSTCPCLPYTGPLARGTHSRR